MKNSNIIYLIGMFFMFASCANVEKMVDNGDYDQALKVAVRKLSGKKNKKAKYVKAAEEAFVRVTNRDMDRIKKLRSRNGIDDWEKIYSISSNMLNRQNKIQPLLPLLDKEGYHAGFNFVKAEVIRNEAADFLGDAYYKLGSEALVHGRRSNKIAARDAYQHFSRVIDFKPRYKDARSLKNEAEQLGITHILVKLENKSRAFLPFRMEDELLSFYNTGRQTKWKKFHINPSAAENMDFVTKVVVSNLEVTPEYLNETVHYFNKQIQEKQFARDASGQFLLDTAGQKIEVFIPRDIRARVVEVNQSKEAVVDMVVEVFDNKGKKLIRRERMQAVGNFNNEACRIDGDRRAIEGRWLNLGEPLAFPTDETLILTAADELKNQVTDYLRKYPFDRV